MGSGLARDRLPPNPASYPPLDSVLRMIVAGLGESL